MQEMQYGELNDRATKPLEFFSFRRGGAEYQGAITADELSEAIENYDRFSLVDVNYAGDPDIRDVMKEFTCGNLALSAGCVAGIKLGLLIAQSRLLAKINTKTKSPGCNRGGK